MNVKRRTLGPSGPSLSQITYGTMRLTPEAVGEQSPADHLCRLHDLGVDTHHSSYEYDSHAVYLDALDQARRTGRAFQHIVKLSEPGFDSNRFDGSRLTSLIDNELSSLGAETIASVQWLFRTPDAQDSDGRIAGFNSQRDEIAAWSATQIKAGKIQNLSVFPYSLSFANAVIESGITGTLTTYLNLAELEATPLLDGCDGFIALRPLAGGRLTMDDPQADELVDPRRAAAYLAQIGDPAKRVATAARFALLHPSVTTTVVSVNSPSNVEAMVEAAGDIDADRAGFTNIVATLKPSNG